jgi:Tfp pilus assembly protein PilW
MKQKHLHPATGFTVTELLVACAAGAVVLAAVTVASVALQKSFSAADNFLGTQMQQIRIVDYLSRDVRRSYIVTASSDLKTITCIIPNYLNGNARSTPTVRTTKTGTVVSYPKSRTVTDAVTTNASATLTSATAAFTLGHQLPAAISQPAPRSKVSRMLRLRPCRPPRLLARAMRRLRLVRLR